MLRAYSHAQATEKACRRSQIASPGRCDDGSVPFVGSVSAVLVTIFPGRRGTSDYACWLNVSDVCNVAAADKRQAAAALLSLSAIMWTAAFTAAALVVTTTEDAVRVQALEALATWRSQLALTAGVHVAAGNFKIVRAAALMEAWYASILVASGGFHGYCGITHTKL